MESGSPPPDRPDSERLGEAPPPGPQAPSGPQSPAGAPAPPGPPAAPGQHPEAAPGYGGAVPPGGWQQPIGRPQGGEGWVGKPLASWGSRVGAQLLDWLILLVPSAILTALVVGVFLAGSDVGGILLAIIVFLLYVLAALFYAPVLMAREGEHNGQTWGKQILGITVVRDNGQQIELGFAFLREFVVKNLLFGFVGSFFAGIPTLVDWLWPLWDDQNRCLHDMVVSTHVIRV
ncbi:MAG TPA: RDD family protein [Thermoleophilaceae bacterium]|jgi:uncharacterized RDD family membrane protein YckC|nr:RDD family protein [Thermoleophilaceae bacterium]